MVGTGDTPRSNRGAFDGRAGSTPALDNDWRVDRRGAGAGLNPVGTDHGVGLETSALRSSITWKVTWRWRQTSFETSVRLHWRGVRVLRLPHGE